MTVRKVDTLEDLRRVKALPPRRITAGEFDDLFELAEKELQRRAGHREDPPGWVCVACGDEVDPRDVTWEEKHDGCGGECYVPDPTTAEIVAHERDRKAYAAPGHSHDAHYRGHPIYWDENGQDWRYTDTKGPIPGYGGDPRPCAYCDADPHEAHEADPCLGELPGVDNACCGHGDPSASYVRFESGVTLRGFIVEKATEPVTPASPVYWEEPERQPKGGWIEVYRAGRWTVDPPGRGPLAGELFRLRDEQCGMVWDEQGYGFWVAANDHTLVGAAPWGPKRPRLSTEPNAVGEHEGTE